MTLTKKQKLIYNADPRSLSKEDLMHQYDCSYHQIVHGDLAIALKKRSEVVIVWKERFPGENFLEAYEKHVFKCHKWEPFTYEN